MPCGGLVSLQAAVKKQPPSVPKLALLCLRRGQGRVVGAGALGMDKASADQLRRGEFPVVASQVVHSRYLTLYNRSIQFPEASKLQVRHSALMRAQIIRRAHLLVRCLARSCRLA
jgi:hypothetical protein